MHMKSLPTLVRTALGACLLAPLMAWAGQTQIAQVPLLNITGTGTVKPNLMLLFDNSGSMDQSYTPDYVNDNLCRSRSTLAQGVMACNVGHPPFMSPDFNKQYYNPAIRYQPPIKSDGSYYPEQTAANTSNWTVVSGDGFNAHKTDLYGNSSSAINLVSGFPDLKWCDPNNTSSCHTNTATYTYPDSTFTSAYAISTGPYYYTIGVAQYCTDATMTSCVSTSAGAAAPAGYPIAVKVRWCNNTLLTNCQGKRVGAYIYPSYSSASGASAAYGTIAIGASASSSSLTISSVTIPDPSTARTITNGTVTASSGTNTALKQQNMAAALAASIIARTGLTNQYYACVKTANSGQPTVPTCSSAFGINLTADNVVAVVPVICSGSKSLANCVTITDSSRAGWGITVNAPSVTPTPATTGVPPTALLAVSGTASNSGSPTVSSVKLGTATVISNVAIARNAAASTIVSTLATAIGSTGTYRAYVGGNAVTAICAAAPPTSLCLLDTTATTNGAAVSASGLSNVTFTGTAATSAPDAIPTTTAALSAGSGAPSTFTRVNLVLGQTYPKGSDRVDCVAAAGVCTYEEEMTNFANWYVYYKTRLQMMKTSVGIAFSAITANYKVGYVKLSNAGVGATIDMVPADFTGSARSSWYTTLYNTTTSGSTPIRTAMDYVGRMFANLTPYNYAAGSEVVQYPCQQNFMILTTDGYWNGSTTNNVVNNDNVENVSRFCTYARGCVDTRAQSQPSISDVSLHWYNGGSDTGTVSLRPPLEPDMSKPGSVPAGAGENTHLHMNTYTLGLGVDGVMTYEPNYDTAPKAGGDFYNLITRVSSGCPWNGGGAYVWPDPDVTNTASTVQERVDDLWHAAINGHGKYFSASQPKEVVQGLSAALANMQIRLGAAAAAATSTPNISLQDNDIFSDTFTTVKWYGELSDKKIDPTTGAVGTSYSWISSDTVGRKVAASTDTRRILMLDQSNAALTDFYYENMSGTQTAWFDNKCAALSQCTLLSAADKAIVNSGSNLVGWLRGRQQYADNTHFRAYTMTSNTPAGATGPVPIVLGDIASSKPAYLRDPRKNYPDASYSQFKLDHAGRPGTVFTAANDGMLHAFDAATGNEVWAYVPRITQHKLYALASTTYGTNHQFSTDGSPELADVKLGANWASVLVAGLNGGGRGYYALDVTDPVNPRALWELCADSSICAHSDPDLGLTFGNPQFGVWGGKWVVFLTSGYNNVPGADGVAGGSGLGYLFIVDVSTGAILKKISTGSGDTTTPSGLAKITSISTDPNIDPNTTYIYGGDNQGQMWRFDLTSTSGAVTVLKMGDAGTTQPITTRPDVTLCEVQNTTTTGGVTTTTTSAQRVVLYGTGRLLDLPDISNTDTQSLYLLKDSGSTIGNIRGATMVQQTLSLAGSSSNVNTYAITSNPVDLTQKDGWFFDWNLNPGERMNLDPQIVSGVANVVTNIPSSSSSCQVGGSSNAYQVDVCTGNAIPGNPAGATLSNTSAAVGFIIIRLPAGGLKMISTMATGETKTTSLQELKSAEAHRVGWRRVKGE
ncbi:PQQ-binding-like beta-propeller repeat protein [Duganella sp. FT3S]|uniref:PQQ-binding-like beta-propeller repeat protein n=2 Tax=Rugamonas fusca TaxID=2758568 RepID=A0A7W2I8G3_9BURK|nr:PQQ-binding-like beta-propeller repeat protein [Rugamonas fusca]